jgi:Flp pilus assembly pilin Flp
MRKGNVGLRNGQTLTEYAFILMLVALVVVAAVTLLGTSIQGFYTGFSGSF